MLVVIFGGYLGTLNSYFISDHFLYLRELSKLDLSIGRDILNGNLIAILKFIPLFYRTNISLIFGTNPLGYHLLSLFLHIINAVLILDLVYIISRKKYLSIFSGLLFGIHPLNVEVAIWNPALSYSLALNFYLISIISFVLYSSYKRNKFYILSLTSFIFSALCKELALSLPFVIITYSLFWGNLKTKIKRRGFINGMKLFIPYFIIIFLYLIIIFISNSSDVSYGYMIKNQLPFYWFLKNHGLFKTTLYYLSNIVIIPFNFLFFPINKYVFENYILIIKIFTFLLLLGPILVLFFIKFKRFFNKISLFGLITTIMVCVPVFFLLDSIDYSGGLVNSRYLYFSTVGFSIFIANSLWVFFTNKKIRSVFVFLILIFYFVLLRGNNSAWIKASEVSYQIPHQTKKIISLTPDSKERIYFLPITKNINNDGLRHYKGIQTYLNWGRIEKAFEIEYGFPVKVCVADINKFEHDKLNFKTSIPDETVKMLEDFDLRSISPSTHILVWDFQNQKVKDITKYVKDKTLNSF